MSEKIKDHFWKLSRHEDPAMAGLWWEKLAYLLTMLVLVVVSMFYFVSSVKAVGPSNFTVFPSESLVDDLIGATNVDWKFRVTTTAALAANDVVQFIFPAINNGQSFNAGYVTTTFTGLYPTVYSSGAPVEKLANGYFDSGVEYGATGWAVNGYGGQTIGLGNSGSIVNDSATGTYAAKLINALSGTKAVFVYTKNSGISAGESYTLHLTAKNNNDGGRLGVIFSASAAKPNRAYWNFVSSTWDLSAVAPTFDSPYVSLVSPSSSFANYTVPSVTVTGTDLTMSLVGADVNTAITFDGLALLKDDSGPDIMSNGSFEDVYTNYPTGWTQGYEGQTDLVTCSTTNPQSGSNFVYLSNGVSTSTKAWVYQVITGLTPGTNLNASFYSKITSGKVDLVFLNGGSPGLQTQAWSFVSSTWVSNTSSVSGLWGAMNPVASEINTSSDWAQTQGTITVPASGSVTVLFLTPSTYDNSNIDNFVSIDSVSLTQSGSSTSPGVGQGMAGEGMGAQPVVYGFVSSTMSTSTYISIKLSGINNPIANRENLQNLVFTVKGGTPVDQNHPEGNLSGGFTVTSTASVVRVGGNMTVGDMTGINLSNTATGTTANYTFNFTPTSSIPVGGKIVLTFPASYTNLLNNISVSSSRYIGSNSSTVSGFTTSTGFLGSYKLTLTVAGTSTLPGDPLHILVSGITNPPVAGVYGSDSGAPSEKFIQYTTLSNGGLIDGSPLGIEGYADYQGPPPPSSVIIGGKNVVNIIVYKQNSAGELLGLLTGERSQIKVNMGNPDKGYFIGSKFLGPNSGARYGGLLDGNYLIGTEPISKAGGSFYDTFLAPGMKSVSLLSSGDTGASVTTSLTFGIPDTTTTLTITGGVPGQFAGIEANSDYYQSFAPVFTDTNYQTPGFGSNGTGYARVKVKSGQIWNFNVQSGSSFGSNTNFSSGTTKYWPPAVPSQYIATSGTIDLGSFAYTQADKQLNVILRTAGTDTVITDACVGVKRTGGTMSRGEQDQICPDQLMNMGTSTYSFAVPNGPVVVTVGRAGKGAPEEYPVAINANIINKTIYLSAPTSYIAVTVQDSSGNAIRNASVFAHGAGFGQGMTGSAGTTTLYVPVGNYSVDGFAPGFGPLTRQTGITVSEGSNPSLTFTVNTNALKTISGRVFTDTNGNNVFDPVIDTGLSGVKIGARGNGSTIGGNGTETDASGNYTLYVPAGTYEVGGWSPDTGGLSPQNANVSSGNVTGLNWALGTQYILRITVNSSTAISPMFSGVFNPTTGRGGGSDSWTTSGNNKYTDIKLPAGTYDVHVGSPMVGEIGNTSVVLDSNKTIAFDLPSAVDFATVSGSVTADGSPAAGANVWASKIGGPGFYSTVTDGSGDYSLKLPKNNNYVIGVKAMGYIANAGDVPISVTSADINGNDFVLSTAGSPITGTVSNASSTAITNAWVSAKKIVDGNEVWTGSPTDGAGNYNLAVDSGTWTIYAEAPGYYRSSGTSTAAGGIANITLSSRSDWSAPVPVMQGITDTSGGQMSDGKTTIDIPANALGSNSSVVSVSLASTTPRQAPNATALPRSVISVNATDSDGNAITSLSSKANLTITLDDNDYTELKVPAAELAMAYFDETTGQWEPMAASFNESTKTFTLQTDHFTDFAPVIGGPDAPTNLAVTSTVAGRIDLSWTAPAATSSYYVIYATTTDITAFPTSTLLTTTSDAFYQHTVAGGSTWYYKVAAVNDMGEGPNSDRANTTALAATAGVTVTESSGSTAVTEGGSTDSYTVVLDSAPSANVVVTVATVSSDISLSTSTLTFTTSNWDTPQTITVTAVDDSSVESTETATITHTAVSSDGDYNGISIASVTTAITDNDTAGSGSTGGGSAADTTAPVNTSIIINSNATSTSNIGVTLTLSASDVSTPMQMMLSNTSTFSGTSWETYTTSKAWTLTTGAGTKTVYAKFKDSLGNTSAVVSDTITLLAEYITTPVATTTITTPVVPHPETTQVVVTPVAVVTITNPDSTINIKPPTAYSYQPGAALKFSYQYTNESDKKVTVKITRQLLDSKGKVMKTTTATRVLKAGQIFNGEVNEAVLKTLKPGEYAVKIKIVQGKTTEENSFKINVEKLKQKYFILGAEQPVAKDIVFDVTTLTKNKSNTLLPINLKAKYSYTNTMGVKHIVKMVRELVGPDGKVLETRTGRWVMKAQETDKTNFTQALAKYLDAGTYMIRIRAYDWTSKEMLAENSIGFVVELK
jgi:hypothetical protein